MNVSTVERYAHLSLEATFLGSVMPLCAECKPPKKLNRCPLQWSAATDEGAYGRANARHIHGSQVIPGYNTHQSFIV